MKFALLAAGFLALSTGMAAAQPTQAQGGGQTGPSGNAGLNAGPERTRGTGQPYLGPEPVYPRGAGQVTGDPNGRPDGPTSLSGTGPSTYGGNNPGAVR